jgi:hypothetical protein
MNVESALKFIKDKIDSPPDDIELIEEHILGFKYRGADISEDDLRLFLNMAAAIQAGVDFRTKTNEQL